VIFELKKNKERLDLLLLKNNLADSRHKAQGLILSGVVKVNGVIISKAGSLFDEDCKIEITQNSCPFVSRGGLKLQGALDSFKIDVKNLNCLDIGSSTGGFTDCLLQNGASKVIALDVGKNLLDEKIKNDERVYTIERFNARNLEKDVLPFEVDFIVIDVSFISLKIILKRVKEVLKNAKVLALIKPQFEAGRKNVKKGIVKDENVKFEVLSGIKEFAKTIGYKVEGIEKSPIKGAKGNEEFFIYLK